MVDMHAFCSLQLCVHSIVMTALNYKYAYFRSFHFVFLEYESALAATPNNEEEDQWKGKCIHIMIINIKKRSAVLCSE